MDAAANTIFKKMDGWWVSGSDKSTILDTLRGKSPEEVAAIKASYTEHFPGHDMDADIGKNLSGKDLNEAKASMSGDPVAASVAAIKNAETGTFFGNVDNDKVKQVLEGIPDPKVRAEVAKQVGGEITGMQSGNDKAYTQALLDNDNGKAAAIKIDDSMHSTGHWFAQALNTTVAGGLLGKDFGLDKDTIYKTMENCSDADRQKMIDDYKARTGQDLRSELGGQLDGANKDVANKLLDGDKDAANAARIKAATESWFTDKDAIYKAMEGKNPDERKKMLDDYKNMYGGSVDATLKQNMSGLDLEKAQQLEQQGKLDDTFALKYAMEGSFWSTDKSLIKQTLAGKSKEEIAALQDKYKNQYGIDLQGELGNTTSGRDGFEINELMKGEPKTVDEKMDRARERYDFERGSGSNVVSKAFVDTFSDKGQLLDQQQARMEDLYKKIKSGQASSDEKALLDRVTGYQDLDTKNYQESKDSVANGAAAVAAITAGAIATVATGGAAAPAEAAIIAALASGGATIATKAIIQDSGYSNEELRNDLIMTGVNAATGGAMGALGAEGGALFNAAGKLTDNAVAQQMIIQGVSGAVTSGVGGATQTMLAGGSAKDMLKAGAMGGLTGGVGGAVTGGVGAGLKGNSMFEGMDPVKAAMLRNGIAGAAGGAASTAIDPDSYKGDSGALLMKWGTAVGGGALGGVAGGYNEGKVEVETQSTVKSEEQDAKFTGEKGETTREADAIEKAKEWAENPDQVKKLQQVEDDLKAGKTPDLATSAEFDGSGKESPVKEPVAPKVEEPAKVDEPAVAKPVEPDKAPVVDKPVEVQDAVDAVDVKKSEELAGPAKPQASDQGDRDALVELSRQAKTDEERAQIAKWAAEIDENNPQPMLDALRDLNIDARSDGHLDKVEGSALREWGHEGSLDRMPLADAMHYEGMDKGEVQRVFDKAVHNDAAATKDPTNTAIHSEHDGTPLAVPGTADPRALTQDEMKLLIDVQARRFDELHPAYTTESGRELEATPMRKAVPDTDPYKPGPNGEPPQRDQVKGDVGFKSTTDQQHSEGAAGTLGLDYDHSSNKYYDPTTNTWTPMVTKDGLPVIDFPLTQEMHDKLQVPLGTDATKAFQDQGRALAQSGDYVPELLQPQVGADGKETFPHLQTRDRESAVDPKTGFGFSATERAIDPTTGAPHAVVPNQEHNLPDLVPVPNLETGNVPTAAKMAEDAKAVAAVPDAVKSTVAAAPEAAEPVKDNPTLAAKVEDKPELAKVVAEAPELGKDIGNDTPVAKVAEMVVEETPKLTAATPKLDTPNPTPVEPAEQASMSPEEAFQRAKASNKDKAVDPKISEDIPGFLKAADEARAGADPELQADRAQFERAVAMSPEAHAAVQDTLDTMCQKAMDYLQRMHGGDLNGALASLGETPTQRSYVGAVGTDPATIKAVFENGNVRERMVALSEFQEKILGPDVLKDGGIEAMQKAFKEGDSSFSQADIDRLAAKRDAYLKTLGPNPTEEQLNSVKGLFGPGGKDGPHAEYAAAKKQDMDTKLPTFAADAASEELGKPVAKNTPTGEASPMSKTTMTVEEAKARGFDLSDREIAMADENGVLPWVVGERANMVDPNAQFIKDAKADSMPLKAGISGTTFRSMGLFDALGADPAMARLACMGQLTAIDAHSFHEIASASQGFFPADSQQRYDQSTPYTSGSMGLSEEQLQAIAKRQNLDLDDLNKPAAAKDTHEQSSAE